MKEEDPNDGELESTMHWELTGNLCRRLFGEVFEEDQVRVETYGNFTTCTVGLYGLAAEELPADQLNVVSRKFVQGDCVRAQKKT